MTNGCGQSVGGIQNLVLQIDAQSSGKHSRYLLFGGIAVAGYDLFYFLGRVLSDGHSLGDGRRHSHALRTAQLEHRLHILAEKRRLNGHFTGQVIGDDFLQLRKNAFQTILVFLVFFEVNDAQVQHRQGFVVYFQNGITQHVGAGIYAEDAMSSGLRVQICSIAKKTIAR